ncbi:hypothetical protein DF121_32535 [Burkholderia stagnalis]|nr:hypothetical protein DF145_32260 [Burkholderia stagnalis]RQX88487.1 hypothetical protein DF121_32535 [Burkholderia stagnalis]
MTHGTRHSALGTRHSALGTRGSALGTRHSALSTQHSALSTQHSALSTQHPETILAAPVPHPSAIPEPAFREMTAISGRRPRSCEAAQFIRSGRMWARIERPFHEMWSILARRS